MQWRRKHARICQCSNPLCLLQQQTVNHHYYLDCLLEVISFVVIVFHRQSWNLLELFLLGNMFVISNVNIDPISINKPNMMFFFNIISFVGDCRP